MNLVFVVLYYLRRHLRKKSSKQLTNFVFVLFFYIRKDLPDGWVLYTAVFHLHASFSRLKSFIQSLQ